MHLLGAGSPNISQALPRLWRTRPMIGSLGAGWPTCSKSCLRCKELPEMQNTVRIFASRAANPESRPGVLLFTVYYSIYYLLLATCYLLFTICYLEFAIYYLLFTFYYVLFTFHYFLFTISYLLFTTSSRERDVLHRGQPT